MYVYIYLYVYRYICQARYYKKYVRLLDDILCLVNVSCRLIL